MTRSIDIKSWMTPKSIIIGIVLIIATFIFPYLTIPALFIWWFIRTPKIGRKAKVISGATLIGTFFILVFGMSFAYYRDETPTLQILEPAQNQVVKNPTVVIRGEYYPEDRNVWINNDKIASTDGSFEFTYDLEVGENQLVVEAGNWKRVKQELTIIRELSDEEIAEQERIEAERAERERQEREAQLAEEEAERQRLMEDEQQITDNEIVDKTTTANQVDEEHPPLDEEKAEISEDKPELTSSETVSQKNAVRSAKAYLDYSAFSHGGLVAQLEYEQFSHTDAVYGADNSGANWNEQAAKAAQAYMEYSAFSRGRLIEQLKYDKFTQAQAEYGANAVGL